MGVWDSFVGRACEWNTRYWLSMSKKYDVLVLVRGKWLESLPISWQAVFNFAYKPRYGELIMRTQIEPYVYCGDW
mgnify:CR=1 FL=1